jgi:hypothetical protein
VTHEDVTARIESQVWQAIARSGGIPSIPQQELAVLVDAIVAGVAAGLQSSIDNATPSVAVHPNNQVSDDEIVLWEGKPHVSAGKEALSTQYEVTSQRIKVTRGMLGKKADETELIRIKDVRVDQGITDRGFGIGDITITTSEANQPELVLRKVARPDEVKEIIRRAVRQEKERRGVTYRDVT